RCSHLRFSGLSEVINARKHAGSAMGASLQLRGAYALGDPDHSVMRHMPLGTPGSGVQVAGSLQTITGSYTGLEDIDIDELSAPPPRSSRALYAALAALLVVGGGGAAVYFATQAPEAPAPAPAAPVPVATAPVAAPAVESPEAPEVPEAEVEAAEAPPPARVLIALRSDPPGAEVFVEDRTYGTTPATVEWVGEAAEAGREVT